MAFRFAFKDTDRGRLRIAAELAKAAGTAAQSACSKAECTQGQHEAALLVGFSKQNLTHIERMQLGILEISRAETMALMTGLRLDLDELTKLQAKEGGLLVTSDIEHRIDDTQRCLRILRCLDEPELALEDGVLAPVEVPDEDGVVEGIHETVPVEPEPIIDPLLNRIEAYLDGVDEQQEQRRKKRLLHKPAKAKARPKVRR